VNTVGDLGAALDAASVNGGQFFLIEVRLDARDVSRALLRLGERVKKAATTGMSDTGDQRPPVSWRRIAGVAAGRSASALMR